MGYRSDVSAVIWADKKDQTVFKEFIGKVKLALPEFFTDWKASDYGWDADSFVFYVESVKWYESYEEIMRFDKLWEIAQGIEGISGKFVRIGEEDDDIEQNSFGEDPPHDSIFVSRAIHLEVADRLGKKGAEDAQEQATQGTQPRSEGDACVAEEGKTQTCLPEA